MLISEFNYELPAELIAQQPLAHREFSRMLVVDRSEQNWNDAKFENFPNYVDENDVIVLNNTRVFPARLIGKRQGFEGRVEVFLVREITSGTWEALARPAKRLSEKTILTFGNEKLRGTILEKNADGKIIVEFNSEKDFSAVLEDVGQTPLPPYISRNQKPTHLDRERYQTVYAKKRGAIAAPTAGLHFTPEIIQESEKRGATIVEVTLHVGYGTFEPIRVEDLSQHQVTPERYEISVEAAQVLNQAKAQKKRIIAVGTTTARALESAAAEFGEIKPGEHLAAMTITPGDKFQMVDALLTNFHLPQSSLLVLVSTFAGHKLIMSAYNHAVAEKYRFYSYGDCMLII